MSPDLAQNLALAMTVFETYAWAPQISVWQGVCFPLDSYVPRSKRRCLWGTEIGHVLCLLYKPVSHIEWDGVKESRSFRGDGQRSFIGAEYVQYSAVLCCAVLAHKYNDPSAYSDFLLFPRSSLSCLPGPNTPFLIPFVFFLHDDVAH